MSTYENDTDVVVLEEDNDFLGQVDDYIISEIEEDRKLEVVSKFKLAIAKEPEFCGIFSLSAYTILEAFRDSKSILLKNPQLTKEQFLIFKSVYYEIFNNYPEDIYIDKIGYNLFDKMYIN
jgi:stalled ribosome rescue protein Dom34